MRTLAAHSAYDLVAAAASLAVTVAGIRLAAWCRAYLILRRLPGPRGDPVMGQLQDIGRPDHHKTLLRWADMYGGIYRIRLAYVNVRWLRHTVLTPNSSLKKQMAPLTCSDCRWSL